MSDRVLFATYDQTTPAGARNWGSSKFSGFPFRVVDDDGSLVGANTYYPLALTADEMMELFWRVKEVEFDSDGQLDDGVAPLFFTDVPFPANTTTRERDLCLLQAGQVFSDANGGFTLGGASAVISSIFRICENSATKVPCYKVGSSYYPRLDIGSTIEVDTPPNPTIFYVTSDRPNASIFADGSFSGSFGPYTLTYYWELGASNPFGFTESITYYDVSFTAYWPYAASDVTPIYNTSTGALLQNPRN